MDIKEHKDSCPSNLCVDDYKSTYWFPSEPICTKTPTTRQQRTQRKIAKLALNDKRLIDTFFTWRMLSAIKVVKRGIKGENPNQKAFSSVTQIGKFDIRPPRISHKPKDIPYLMSNTVPLYI